MEPNADWHLPNPTRTARRHPMEWVEGVSTAEVYEFSIAEVEAEIDLGGPLNNNSRYGDPTIVVSLSGFLHRVGYAGDDYGEPPEDYTDFVHKCGTRYTEADRGEYAWGDRSEGFVFDAMAWAEKHFTADTPFADVMNQARNTYDYLKGWQRGDWQYVYVNIEDEFGDLDDSMGGVGTHEDYHIRTINDAVNHGLKHTIGTETGLTMEYVKILLEELNHE